MGASLDGCEFEWSRARVGASSGGSGAGAGMHKRASVSGNAVGVSGRSSRQLVR
jgi:hypothetical protein